jgi:hypothetical protein
MRSSFLPAVKNWLREPLLHFLLLGAALFAVYAFANRSPATSDSTSQIVLTPEDVRELTAYLVSQQHRAPTADELNDLVEKRIQEEVLYREALAMGLDKHDAAMRSHLAQKFQAMTESFIDIPEPTTAELEAWYAKNADKLVGKPGGAPPFQEIQAEVKKAWLSEHKQQAWRKTYDGMRAKYTVRVPSIPSSSEPKAAGSSLSDAARSSPGEARN